MTVAYLVNRYPEVSHSFIRREIQALERAGLRVTRFAIRGWDSHLANDTDTQERLLTRFILRDGARSLLIASLFVALNRPKKFWAALRLVRRMAMKADRAFPVHLAYLAEACRIVLWIQETGAQHLHAHFGTNSAEVAMLAHALGGPSWSFTVHGPEEFDKPLFIGLPEKIRQCAFAVAVSSYGRSQLYRLVEHTLWSKLHVIHCGLEPEYFELTANRDFSKHRFVCVGRLAEQKGLMLLLEAAYRLAAKGRIFELVLAGDGEMRPELERFITEHRLSDKVRITGWLSSDQVRNEITSARALVLPSFAEGLPVVIMEAMALRTPVITTFVAGIPELIQSGEHGWLIPAGDVVALVEAMDACLDAQPATLEDMGNKSHARVLARHNIDTEASRLAKLFSVAISDNMALRAP